VLAQGFGRYEAPEAGPRLDMDQETQPGCCDPSSNGEDARTAKLPVREDRWEQESSDEALPSLRQAIWIGPISPLHLPVLHCALS
jgi:hypothetical protein